jgi:glycosyltransferase involved in cell wall biosynthesis
MSEKLKVLWVTNALGCGGAERQMLYMYDILTSFCNIDITILYYAKVGDALDIDGVKTVFVDKSKVGKIETVRQIKKYIKENDIQIMHAFGGSSANIYGRFGAIGTKAIPVGAVLGKKHFVIKGIAIANSLLNLFGNWWTVNNSELIPILKRDIAFVNDKKIRLLHNGFVPASKVDYQKNIETEFDDDKKNNFIFSVVGRLQPVKNYDLFLKAAKEILKKHGNVRFWVVGNGGEYDHLTKLASALEITDNVRFWGYRTDVDTAMSRSDCFVQTSFTEGSPNTIAEAMRASKPIISTKSTDLSEMIDDDKNGYVVENDNCTQLVEAMEKILLKQADEYKAMCAHSERLFEKNFLDERVAEEFEAFYNELIKDKE